MFDPYVTHKPNVDETALDEAVVPIDSDELDDQAEDKPKRAAKKTTKKATKKVAESKSKAESKVVQIIPNKKKDWFILKVQVNREDSIKESILRRATMAGLIDFFGDILVPSEKITEFRGGQKKITTKKMYPGYLMIFMEITQDSWFLVRETQGVADFTGAIGRPTPMSADEVARILASAKEATSESVPKLKIAYEVGDKIKVKEGTFENFEGEVYQIDMSNGRVTVMLTIFGRSTPVELEYWQIEHPK